MTTESFFIALVLGLVIGLYPAVGLIQKLKRDDAEFEAVQSRRYQLRAALSRMLESRLQDHPPEVARAIFKLASLTTENPKQFVALVRSGIYRAKSVGTQRRMKADSTIDSCVVEFIGLLDPRDLGDSSGRLAEEFDATTGAGLFVLQAADNLDIDDLSPNLRSDDSSADIKLKAA